MPLPSPTTARPIRVLVVDDSPFMRRAIQRLIDGSGIAAVIGTAADGAEAVRRTIELRPDVITMDVEMPHMDGVAAVSEIMASVPTPVVMLSSLTAAGADTTLRALEAGAVEAVAKPSGLSHELTTVSAQLAVAILRASTARPQPWGAAVRLGALGTQLPSQSAPPPCGLADHVVVIGSSTGGPPALTRVIPRLPGKLAAGVLVVQHLPPGFTSALARRLDSISELTVSEAQGGEPVERGRVLIAPGGFHMSVAPNRRIQLNQDPPRHGVRPSVDVTLESVCDTYGGRATVAILTGMGRDGADGAAQIEARGGTVVTQDEATCVVFGMPRVAKERTRHGIEADIDSIAARITDLVGVIR